MRFAGFAFLAAALTLVFHAYEPGSFDPHGFLPDNLPAEPVAEPAPSATARNFALSVQPTLRSLDERAAMRNARGSETAAPVAVAMLPAATPVASSSLERAVPAPMSSLAPQDDVGRGTLVRNIKRELRRVGCFYGRLDDDWDASAQGAANTFMDRVNATLPNTPDHVLLALVRNHKSGACDGSCPRGQTMSRDGRCLPDAIVAKMTRGSPAATEVRRPAMTEPFTTTVAELQTTAARASQPDETAGTRSAKRPPLPGRMAMGAAGSGSEASGNWWDGFMSPTSPPPAQKEQTLDRPVGLTHVPAPRPAKPVEADQRETRTASLSGDAEGMDGPALQPAAISVSPPTERAAPVRRAKSARAYRPRTARSREERGRSARRWSGRNVQTMFQHPLGRM